MVNGTYICEKHDNILAWAESILTLCELMEADGMDYTDEIRELAKDIHFEAKMAKIDGQKMEDRLVERAAQGDSILKLAGVFDRLAVQLENSLPPKL